MTPLPISNAGCTKSLIHQRRASRCCLFWSLVVCGALAGVLSDRVAVGSLGRLRFSDSFMTPS